MGIMDDILVTGSTEEEHDTVMTKDLKRTKKNNIGYYPDKLQYKQKRVNLYHRTWQITHRRKASSYERHSIPPKCKRTPHTDGNDCIPQ